MSLVDHPATRGSKTESSNDPGNDSLLDALLSLRQGDFSVRLPANDADIDSKLAEVFNEVMELLQGVVVEVDRIKQISQNEDRTKWKSRADELPGSWSALVESVHAIAQECSVRACQPGRGSSGADAGQLGSDESSGKPNRAIGSCSLINTLPRVKELKVLLAEDIRANQQIVVRTLQKRGHAVEVASNGYQAVELATSNTYDVILMDVQMPGMDGYEATMAIRSSSRHAKVPIIALTAHGMAEDHQRCLDAGMNDCLVKPLDLVCLVQVVEDYATQKNPIRVCNQ